MSWINVTASPRNHGRDSQFFTASLAESDEEKPKVSALQALVASRAIAVSNGISQSDVP